MDIVEKRVYMTRCPDYGEEAVALAVENAFDAFGGVGAIADPGDRVLIKPNLLMARPPEGATTTHPVLVAAVARMFRQAGADVVIADSPGGTYNVKAMEKVYKTCGMEWAAEQSGARLNFDMEYDSVKYAGVKEHRTFAMIRPVQEADVIINLAKMKTHMLAYYTGAAKNLFGCIAGLHKPAMHAVLPRGSDFCAMLYDLCQCIAPAFSLIDGIEGMDGKGPSGGRTRQCGVVIASPNPFAADLAAMDFCGLEPGRAPIQRLAAKQGASPPRAAQLELLGDRLPPLDPPFDPPPVSESPWNLTGRLPGFLRRRLENRRAPYPDFTAQCVGCGECAKICPKRAIVIAEGKAVLDKGKCIRCYCCHELCPIKAIDV